MKLKTSIVKTFSVVAMALTLSSNVFAGADCPEAPRDTWLPDAQMQRMILDKGFSIDLFKVDDNCYEIYGKNEAGEKVEIYFDPVNGEIVKQEKKD